MAVKTTPKDLPLASLKQELIDSLPEDKEWTNSDTCVVGNLMFLNISDVTSVNISLSRRYERKTYKDGVLNTTYTLVATCSLTGEVVEGIWAVALSLGITNTGLGSLSVALSPEGTWSSSNTSSDSGTSIYDYDLLSQDVVATLEPLEDTVVVSNVGANLTAQIYQSGVFSSNGVTISGTPGVYSSSSSRGWDLGVSGAILTYSETWASSKTITGDSSSVFESTYSSTTSITKTATATEQS